MKNIILTIIAAASFFIGCYYLSPNIFFNPIGETLIGLFFITIGLGIPSFKVGQLIHRTHQTTF